MASLVPDGCGRGIRGAYVPGCSEIIISDCDQVVLQAFINTRLRDDSSRLTGLDGWDDPAVREDFFDAQRHWMYCNQVGGASVTMEYPHGFSDYYDLYGTTHPEYFNLLPNGIRGPDPYYGGATAIAMCAAQPSLWSQIVDHWIAAGAHGWINCNENDTWGKCTCPLCMAWDVEPANFQADYGCTWADRLTQATADFYDAKFEWYKPLGPMADRYCAGFIRRFWMKRHHAVIPMPSWTCLAYKNYRHPPLTLDGQLSKNMVIDIVPRSTGRRDSYFPWTAAMVQETKDEVDGWKATGATLTLRPNYALYGHNFPYYFADQLGIELDYAYRVGAYHCHGLRCIDWTVCRAGAQSLCHGAHASCHGDRRPGGPGRSGCRRCGGTGDLAVLVNQWLDAGVSVSDLNGDHRVALDDFCDDG